MSTSTAVNVVPLETASDIAERRNDVLSQYQAFKDALALRRQQLQDVLELQNFRRDANELEKWIGEKMAIVNDENWKDLTNLENRLQKHAALEAEINANAGALKKLDDAGQEMIEKDHFGKDSVTDRLEELHKLWDELLAASKYQGERLRQMRALVDYIRECDEVLSWIKDKEAVIASGEEGKDVEHVQMLQRKFDELQAEIVAQSDRVKEVNDTADRMVEEENHPEADAIREKQKEVADSWDHLNELAKEKSDNLSADAEVQEFKRDVEETIGRMNEKEKVLLSNDVGHDVPSVQALQRRHEGVERDLAALEEKVAELQAEADRLEDQHDDLSVEKEKDAVNEHWERVTDAAKKRKKDLDESYDLQVYSSGNRFH